jgi:hypothetical protein
MGNLRRGIDVWRQGTRPKKIASEGTPPKEMQKVTSHVGLAPVNGHLRGEHWAGWTQSPPAYHDDRPTTGADVQHGKKHHYYCNNRRWSREGERTMAL